MPSRPRGKAIVVFTQFKINVSLYRKLFVANEFAASVNVLCFISVVIVSLVHPVIPVTSYC